MKCDRVQINHIQSIRGVVSVFEEVGVYDFQRCKTLSMIFETLSVIFKTLSVISETLSVIFETLSVIFETLPVIFETLPIVVAPRPSEIRSTL